MSNFKIVPNERFPEAGTDHYVELLEGSFSGLCFNINQLEFVGEDDEGNGKISFNYDLVFVPETITLNEEMLPSLEEVISSTLHSILTEALNETQELLANETRNSNTNESTTE